MKTRKRETKAGKEARYAFYEAVLGRGGCWFQQIVPHQCDGPIDPCHLLPKQRLKHIAIGRQYDEKETLELVWDPRNGVPGCRAYHHRLDNGFLRVRWNQLPLEAHAFAFAWALEWEMQEVFQEEE